RIPRTPTTHPKPYFVSTPIFYVNAAPHIGHLHSDLVADVLARYHAWRQRGWSPQVSTGQNREQTQPLLSTGTDEHGLKIQKVAEQAGEDPQKLCDRISQRFRDLAVAANLSEHRFIRTTEPQHAEAVKEIWRRLQDGGYIYKGEHSGWYAVSDEAFYTDQQVQERVDSKTGEKFMESIETGQRVEWTSEENYKFRLSLFRDALLAWHAPSQNQDPSAARYSTPLQPPSQHAALLAELQAGELADLSVSRPRSRLHWGIPVPDDDEHTIYVWIDALVNYLTVTGFPWAGAEGPHGEGSAWPADVHVVGKDIVRFHAVYWPAMLMAANLPLPRHIVAHAHWTMDKAKMSKSRGNVVDPFVALQQFRPRLSLTAAAAKLENGRETSEGSVDILRWYLMRVGGNLATDSDYSETLLWEYHRKYLQGQIGNLASRAVAPKVLQRLLPPASSTAGQTSEEVEEVLVRSPQPVHAEDAALEAQIRGLAEVFDTHMQRFELSKALQAVHDVVASANELISRLEPWAPTSTPETIARAVYYSTETLRLAALLLGSTVMPERMSVLLDVVLGLRAGFASASTSASASASASAHAGEGEEGTRWEDVEGGKLREVVRLKMRRDGAKITPLFPPLAPPPKGKVPAQAQQGGGKGKAKAKTKTETEAGTGTGTGTETETGRKVKDAN
ncbi:methionyl-tRNA synthetase, partial [Tilletia horrida]